MTLLALCLSVPLARSGDSGYSTHCGALPCLTVGQNEALGQAGSGISMYISYPGGGTGKLTIDPDRVDVFVRYLKQARDKLQDIDRRGQAIIDVVEAPGDDPFSPRAVDDIVRTAGETAGGHAYANRRAQEVFQAIIDKAQASLAAYRAQEVRGTDRFRGDG